MFGIDVVDGAISVEVDSVSASWSEEPDNNIMVLRDVSFKLDHVLAPLYTH